MWIWLLYRWFFFGRALIIIDIIFFCLRSFARWNGICVWIFQSIFSELGIAMCLDRKKICMEKKNEQMGTIRNGQREAEEVSRVKREKRCECGNTVRLFNIVHSLTMAIADQATHPMRAPILRHTVFFCFVFVIYSQCVFFRLCCSFFLALCVYIHLNNVAANNVCRCIGVGLRTLCHL